VDGGGRDTARNRVAVYEVPEEEPWPRRRRRLVYTILVVAALIASGYMGVRANEKHVTIDIDGKIRSSLCFGKTVGEVLSEAGVVIAEHDVVSPSLDSPCERQQYIAVRRAVPVEIVVDGHVRFLMTTRESVWEVLDDAGVCLGELDHVEPKLDSQIRPHMLIEVTRIREEILVETEPIEFGFQKREDYDLELGVTRIVQAGETGLKEVRHLLVYENSRKVSSTLLESLVVRQPVTQIVAYGTAGTITRGSQTLRFKKCFDMTATAYYPGPESTGRFADGYTAIGMVATHGVVAVDPSVIPLRSRLYVDGYGFAVAGDVGSAIKGMRIDLCFDTLEEAMQWGRQPVKVYLLD